MVGRLDRGRFFNVSLGERGGWLVLFFFIYDIVSNDNVSSGQSFPRSY